MQPQFKKRLVLLDFDALSKMKHAPTPLEGLDWHFQCIFNFEVRHKPYFSTPQHRDAGGGPGLALPVHLQL